MAKVVQAQVAGGQIKQVKNVDTVEELRDKLDLDKNYTASVKGEPSDDEQELDEYDFVSFSQAVKGGM